MQINKVAFIGKGGVGLLYGSMIARALGDDAVEFVMDDARFQRHAADQLKINGEPCGLRSVRASEAGPADLVILAVKTTGLNQALDTMRAVVGPDTRIASLCNGITSEQKIAACFGWKRTVLGICQGMDAVFLNSELTYGKSGEIRFGAAPEPGGEQRRSLVAAMREALAVANAEGIALTEADLSQMVRLIEGLDPAGMPSMAQDRINRRKTEVEEFSGTICRLAARHDIQVPQNEWLYTRICEIEAGW